MPAVVDLAAMRNAMADLGGDPSKINPLIPAELVIDHSVQVDAFASRMAFGAQRRARVRAQPRALPLPPLGPGGVQRLQGRAAGHRHLPPGEPRVPRARRRGPRRRRVPGHARRHRLAHDDDQRPRRARLGRRRDRGRGGDARRSRCRCSCRRSSASSSAARCPDGATATDLVLTVTEMLRKTGVVGKFVEYFGDGPRRRCRSPTARRSGTCRPSTARPAASSPSTR